MKRIVSLFTSLVMVISLLSVMPAIGVSAETSGDYEYEILDDGTLKITKYCGSATTLTVPSTISGKKVTMINDAAFGQCEALVSVTISSGIETIGWYAFAYCDNLKSVEMPNSVSFLGYGAFIGCSSLESLTIPNSVEGIDGETFGGCTSLKSIVIPKSVTYIHYSSFFSCPEVFKIYCYKDSCAEQHAKEFGYNYELLDSTSVSTPTAFKLSLNSPVSVRLAWDKNENADGYILEQYKSGKWTRIARIADNDTTVYSVKKLASGTTYKFRMKAYKMSGGKAYYSGYTSTLTTCTKPATPKAKMALNSSVSVRLSWNKVTGAGGYIVEQYKNGSWVRVAKVSGASTVQYSVKGLTSGTTYKFRVKAYKMLGGKAYYSDYSSTVTACTKPATVKFSVSAVNGKATVNWNKVTGASGYIVYYRTSPSKGWTRIAKVNASTTSYTKTGLTGGKAYYFTVKAYKTLGGTPYYGGITSAKCTVLYKGWQTINGNKYYYNVNYKKVTGYQKLGSDYYYFSSNGVMQTGWQNLDGSYCFFNRANGKQIKNSTVDGIKIGADGKATTSTYNTNKIETMMRAHNILLSITKPTDTMAQKRLKCFNWVMDMPYHRFRLLEPIYKNTNWEITFANDIFLYRCGDCVSESAAIAFLFKEIGYEEVYVCHDTSHAWVMVGDRLFDSVFAAAKGFDKNYNVIPYDYRKYPVQKVKI